MKTVFVTGLLLGVLVVAWQLVMGYTGWYKDRVMLNLFFAVIPIQIAVLWWGLRRTAAEGRRYLGQVVAGLLVSLIGGVLIVGGSYLFTSVLFPNYFAELAAIYERDLRTAGQSEPQVQAALAAYARVNNANVSATAGFVGTVVTGLVVSLVLAAFVRRR